MTPKNDIFQVRTSRRNVLLLGISSAILAATAIANKYLNGKSKRTKHLKDVKSHIFNACNGSPQRNVATVIEMMGGIASIIGRNDIVIIKPNLQWWNQGRTNLAAIKGCIDLIVTIPGFTGKIIIAENHHFTDDASSGSDKDDIRGWSHVSEINGDIDGINQTMNSMIETYHRNGHLNISKVHWRDGGPKSDRWGNGKNGGCINDPSEGNGYLWTDFEYTFKAFWGLRRWKVKMS